MLQGDDFAHFVLPVAEVRPRPVGQRLSRGLRDLQSLSSVGQERHFVEDSGHLSTELLKFFFPPRVGVPL